MGRRKKITVIEEPEPIEAAEPTPAEQAAEVAREERELQDQIQTAEWLAEFQNRFTDQPAKILVEKFDEEGDWAVCRKYPLAKFDPDAVRLEYGGGKYRCTLFDSHGKWVKEGRTHFKFANSIIKPVVDQKPENPLENPVVVMMIKSMESQQHMMMELAKSFLTAPNVPGAGKSSGLSEVVEVVQKLNTMTAKEKPMDSLKETLGLMKLVKEVTGDSDGEGKGGLLSDLKDVIEVLPLLKEHIGQLKTPAPMLATPAKKETELDPLTQKIVDLVPKFIGGARSNAPVPEWGSYLFNVFDSEIVPLLLPVMKEKYRAIVSNEDDVYDIVIKLAKDPAERAAGLKQIPPLAPYLAWVNPVIDEAIRIAESPEPEATAGGGNAILAEIQGKPESAAKD